MAKSAQSVGSDTAELKKLLRHAESEPVNVAFGFGKDGKAVIAMDLRKKGRALLKSLQDGMPDGKNFRFGTAEVGQDSPDTVKFVVNKDLGGAGGTSLKVALKGTGFAKVEISTDAGDGSEDPAGGKGDEETPPSLDEGTGAQGSGDPGTGEPETTEPETTGPETTGPETTGPETTGPETTGPETTGPETTGPGAGRRGCGRPWFGRERQGECGGHHAQAYRGGQEDGRGDQEGPGRKGRADDAGRQGPGQP